MKPDPGNGCRFPIGDPHEPGFHYCGKKREGTRSYCTEHENMTHVPHSSAAARRIEHAFAFIAGKGAPR